MTASGLFTGNEMITMAIQTEVSGREFYEAAAEAASHADVQNLLKWLAGQEALHERTFRSMLDEGQEKRPSEEYEGQKSEYIQALLASRVLPDPECGKQALARMEKDAEVVEFALGFEKDTILFMYAMRDLVPDSNVATVDRLIAEEKTHVERLNQIRARVC